MALKLPNRVEWELSFTCTVQMHSVASEEVRLFMLHVGSSCSVVCVVKTSWRMSSYSRERICRRRKVFRVRWVEKDADHSRDATDVGLHNELRVYPHLAHSCVHRSVSPQGI